MLALHQSPPSGSPAEILAELVARGAALPTHSVRSQAQIALQQFSTPAPIAYLAARLLGARAGETVLEPSAGTGLLAVFAALAGAQLILNERDPGRAELLEAAFPACVITRHDAEILGDHLGGQRFDAVLMNPPFSRSEGRGIDRRAGLRHLRAALTLLTPHGRCVAILPDRFDRTASDWLTATAGYVVTAAYDLPVGSFAKHGTAQAVSLVRLEPAGAAEGPRLACDTLATALSRIAALRVDILPDREQVGDIARRHALECRPTTEDGAPVRLVHPFMGAAWQQDLQALVDAKNVGNPLEGILRDGSDGSALPRLQCGAAVQPQQTHLVLLLELPGLCDAEEGPQRRAGQILSARRRHNLGLRGHLIAPLA